VKTLFSTADVRRRDAFDYWHEMLCKKVVPHDCTPEDRRVFQAKIQGASLADIALVQYQSTAIRNDVTERHVAHANADVLLVRRQTSGMALCEQDGREVKLEAGDITVLDPCRPMRATYLNGARQLILKVPRRELEARIGDMRNVVARSIKPSGAEHGLTSAYLAMLPTYADRFSAAGAQIVRDQTLDLIAVSLAKSIGGRQPHVSSARSLVPLNAHAAIETRPAEASRPTLSPLEREVLTWTAWGKSALEIAEILNISKRTVDAHVQAATAKLGAANKTQAVANAILRRIIEI